MIMEITTLSHEDTFSLGESLGTYCKQGITILLDGDLAAGKTVFSKGLGFGFGVEGNIKSPSYTLMCSYEGKELPFYHFDAYNLQGLDDFYELGFDAFLYENAMVVIEWGSIIAGDFPEEYLHVQIKKGQDDERFLTFTAHGESVEKIVEGWWKHEHSGL